MTFIEISLPWLVLLVIAGFALYGVAALAFKLHRLLRALWLIRTGASDYEQKLNAWLMQFHDHADRQAQAVIDEKIKQVWRLTSPTKTLDIKVLQKESLELVSKIAQVYYPSSERPELEATLLELIDLNKRVSEEVQSLVEPFPLAHSISLATIIETRAIFTQTQGSLTYRGLITGGKLATRAWMAWNVLRPTYWINKALFKGAGEVVSRKILATIFRIVGGEALRVYKTSAKTHIDPALLKLDELSLEIESPAPASASLFECQAKTGGIHDPEPLEDPIVNGSHDEQNTQTAKQTGQGETSAGRNETPTVRQKLYSSVASTLSQFLEGSLHLWDKLVSRESVLKGYVKRGYLISDLEDIRQLPIEAADEVAGHYIRMGEWYTAAEGAATGMGGFLMLSADAVSLLALQLRTIQQIGYCYGFDVTRPEEKLFAAKLLAEAYTHPAKGQRRRVINTMHDAAKIIQQSKPLGLIRQRLFVAGLSKAAEKIGLKLGGRATGKIVPVIGAVAGGYINKKITKDIAEIAKEVYRQRLQERQGGSG